MEIQFLGTGAGSPSKSRNVSSLALKLLDERNEVWLFDAGKAHNIRFYKPLFDHEKLPKYLLLTCMGIIFLACQGFWPVAPTKAAQIR